MKLSHAAALWIFKRLALDQALAGDLLEEYAQGRSASWYWKQVIVAVWVGIWSTIFEHKVLALRALATSCAVNGVWLFLWLRFLHIGLPIRPKLSMESFASLLIILFTQTVTGWVVARAHRAHAIPMVSVFAIWLIIWYPGNTDLPYLKMLFVDSIDQPRFRPYLAAYLAWIAAPLIAQLAGLFTGGIIGARPLNQTSIPSQT